MDCLATFVQNGSMKSQSIQVTPNIIKHDINKNHRKIITLHNKSVAWIVFLVDWSSVLALSFVSFLIQRVVLRKVNKYRVFLKFGDSINDNEHTYCKRSCIRN